jgi:hypothetical protein
MPIVTICYRFVIILGNLYIVRKCQYDTTYGGRDPVDNLSPAIPY